MWDQLRATIPLFVLFAGVGMAVILMTRQPDTPQATPPTPEAIAPETRRALMALAADPATALNACQTAYETGDYLAASDVCSAAANTLPENDEILMARAQAYELQGLEREAIRDYRTITNRADPATDLYEAARNRLEVLTE